MNSTNLSPLALLTSSLTADAGLYRGSWKLNSVSQQHQTPCRRLCSMSGTNFRNFPPLFDFFSSTLQFPHSTQVKSKQTRHAKVPACSIVLIVLRFGLLVFVGSVHSARMLTRPIDRRPGRPHQNGARSGRGCRGEGAHCGACQAQA